MMFFKRRVIPPKLKSGDEVRIVALAMSLDIVRKAQIKLAVERLESLGLKVTFGKHVYEYDDFESSRIASRVKDLDEAFRDKKVKGILAVEGGFNSNQLLRYIDWEVVRRNPKIICGYSDITAISNAFWAKTGLVGYSGPLFSSFGQKEHFEYTMEYFRKCVMKSEPFEIEPSEYQVEGDWENNPDEVGVKKNSGPWVINEGEAKGTIVGGNLSTLALLQGTEYMPDLSEAIVFLEDDYEFLPHHFDRVLQGLIHLPNFKGVRGLVWGHFQKESKMTDELLRQICDKQELKGMPILANVDFGHTTPKITFPIGGVGRISGRGKRVKVEILEH